MKLTTLKQKFIFIAIFILLFFLFGIFLMQKRGIGNYYYNLEYQGIVRSKFLDSDVRYEPTITIEPDGQKFMILNMSVYNLIELATIFGNKREQQSMF
jgi:hypothetical protein